MKQNRKHRYVAPLLVVVGIIASAVLLVPYSVPGPMAITRVDSLQELEPKWAALGFDLEGTGPKDSWPLATIVEVLSQSLHIPIVIADDVDENSSIDILLTEEKQDTSPPKIFHLKPGTLGAFLDEILTPAGLAYRIDDGQLKIVTREE